MSKTTTPTESTAATPTVTFRKIGNSIGATFPKEVVDAAGITEKSTWHVVQTSQGLLLKEYDEAFEKGMAAYRVVAEQYKNTLRELAQ
ncbi:AbrB/MazE/SpoVT family DNA-binding domain-containing protein [Rubrivirga sp.]|uniref:AbrB/MazE/SpoVT family DNA-binding domain-containing protein n=1 Tax=Rubrivirga sp. TaxID=1885344 RepID=UPI003C78025A